MQLNILPPQSKNRLDALQALRAIAAGLVIFDHAVVTLVEKAGLDQTVYPVAWFLGELGVALFFCISGF
ncbi:acyltransferase family protein, partial [Acinetobacter baumannii]